MEIIDNASSSDSGNDSAGDRTGNRTQNQEEAERRAAERRLLRENNPLSISNLEAITQRLGIEAADRFRTMLQNRRAQNTSRVTNRIDITWLRNQLPAKEVESIEDKNASNIKAVVNWYGSIGGILAIRLNKTNVKELELDYK